MHITSYTSKDRGKQKQKKTAHFWAHHVLPVSAAAVSTYRPKTIVLKNGATYKQQICQQTVHLASSRGWKKLELSND